VKLKRGLRMADRDTLIPDPLESSQNWQRFYCLDIVDLSDMELLDERNYLLPRLWGEPQISWLRERAARLEDELKKRQGNTRGQPKAKHAEGVKP